MKDFEEIIEKFNRFADERDWAQFHTPKNVAIALSVEVSEILEILQWLSDKEIQQLVESEPNEKEKIENEIVDSLFYLMKLVDLFKVDLDSSIKRKIMINAEKYPAEKVRGSAKKYDEYKNRD
ncbi:MAG: nucleotide pyrophosphohydrolase [Bacteriovoracaceae bacterium]